MNESLLNILFNIYEKYLFFSDQNSFIRKEIAQLNEIYDSESYLKFIQSSSILNKNEVNILQEFLEIGSEFTQENKQELLNYFNVSDNPINKIKIVNNILPFSFINNLIIDKSLLVNLDNLNLLRKEIIHIEKFILENKNFSKINNLSIILTNNDSNSGEYIKTKNIIKLKTNHLNPSILPDFDVLCAGFPCQAFSIAGKKKGFEDTRGTLFFDVCRIIKEKQPKIIFLENVKNLTQHDEGRTFSTIISSLKNLNYHVYFKILNAKDFSIPQHRERIIIVGVNQSFSNKDFHFNFPEMPSVSISSILEKNHTVLNDSEYTIIDQNMHKKQKSGLIFCGYRNKNIRKIGVKENSLHLSRTHKQPNRIYHVNGNHPTLSSQESSGRYFVYDEQKVFQLTLLECFRLMGFPDNYVKIGSKANLYNRIGNSVCVPMIHHVMKNILEEYF